MVANPVLKHGFDFDYLYQFTHDPSTPRDYIIRPYHNQSILALTFKGCVDTVGRSIAPYSRQGVYDRAVLWRVPLGALWLTTTLPPFVIHTQIFTLLHLVGDPIDSIWSLLYRLDLAKRTFRWVQEEDAGGEKEDADSENRFIFRFLPKSITTPVSEADEGNKTWSASSETNAVTSKSRLLSDMRDEEDPELQKYCYGVAALIVTAYDDWGKGGEASDAIYDFFNTKARVPQDVFDKITERCEKAAFLVASDRVSQFLPASGAFASFLIHLSAGFWNTLNQVGDTYDPSNPVSAGLNRSPHNIAFGASFFWLPFVVLMTGLMGGSQTSHMNPRVLEELRQDLDELKSYSVQTKRPSGDTEFETRDIPGPKRSLPNISNNKYKRWLFGGLPVWQVEKFTDYHKDTSHRSFARLGMALSFTVVAIPTACAIAISWQTPTEGFGCRGVTQLSFLGLWILSAMIDWLLFLCARGLSENAEDRSQYSTIYWCTFVKDCVFTCVIIVTLTWSATGAFNSCACWCKYPTSSGFLSFPQDEFIFQMIKSRLRERFPIIVSCALLSQIFIFAWVCWQFREGLRVLKLRDIDSVLEARNSYWNRLCRRLKKSKSHRRKETM